MGSETGPTTKENRGKKNGGPVEDKKEAESGGKGGSDPPSDEENEDDFWEPEDPDYPADDDTYDSWDGSGRHFRAPKKPSI